MKIPEQQGFTLIEVITVLLLLIIVSAIVVPRMLDTGADNAAAVNRIKTHLRYTQIRSMNSEGTWGIKFDNTSHTYWLFNTISPNNEDDAIKLPSEDADQISFPSSMTITPDLIAFDSLGSPFSDAALQNAFVLGTMNLGNGDIITITKNTGHIP